MMSSKPWLWLGVGVGVAALLNVAVAWTCAVVAQRSPNPVTAATADDAQRLIQHHALITPQPPMRLGGRLQNPGYLEVMLGSVAVGGPSPYVTITITDIQAGLPFKSMRRGAIEWQDPATWNQRYIWSRRAVASASTTQPIIPLEPIWVGFAANTALYAAILFAIVLIPRWCRRLIRRRRGLCIACGYPRGPSAACSECGRAFEPIQTAQTTPTGAVS